MDRKEELIAAARSVAERLGTRRLSLAEFTRETGVTTTLVYGHFDSWPALCAAARIRAKGGIKTDCSETLFADMRDAFLAHGGICSQRKFFSAVGLTPGVFFPAAAGRRPTSPRPSPPKGRRGSAA